VPVASRRAHFAGVSRLGKSPGDTSCTGPTCWALGRNCSRPGWMRATSARIVGSSVVRSTVRPSSPPSNTAWWAVVTGWAEGAARGEPGCGEGVGDARLDGRSLVDVLRRYLRHDGVGDAARQHVTDGRVVEDARGRAGERLVVEELRPGPQGEVGQARRRDG